jgi:hypothetical protein
MVWVPNTGTKKKIGTELVPENSKIGTEKRYKLKKIGTETAQSLKRGKVPVKKLVPIFQK